MPKKGRSVSKTRGSTVRVRNDRRALRSSSRVSNAVLLKLGLPLLVAGLLLGGIFTIVFLGYDTATRSAFFRLQRIDVQGTERTSKEDITRVVSSSVERTGVWNADLAELKIKIEKFPFVKSAAVARSLPIGITVNVVERTPAAVVKMRSGNYLVDTEGVILTQVKAPEKEFPFILHGWDESKTEKAGPDNISRIKMYQRMIDEASQFELVPRVKEFDIANLRQPTAIVEDSGRSIAVSLSRDGLGKSLKTAVDALTGKGARIKSVDSAGVQPIIQYLDL